MAKINPKRRSFHTRGFTTILLTFSFIIVAVSGIALYLSPATRASRTLWGLSHGAWSLLHMNSCAVLLVVSVEHLLFNWHALTGYFVSRATRSLALWKEFLLAFTLAVFLVVGTIQRTPPFNVADFYSGAVRHARQAMEKAEPTFKLDELEEFDEEEFFRLPEPETTAKEED